MSGVQGQIVHFSEDKLHLFADFRGQAGARCWKPRQRPSKKRDKRKSDAEESRRLCEASEAKSPMISRGF